jgi:hypothetical protein
MASLLERLNQVIGADRVSKRKSDLEAVARDESSQPAGRADVVVWPGSTEEVAAVVTVAAETGTPVTARGAGSSLEGNSIPMRGGIVLDLSRMQRIVEIRAEDLQVVVEPGVVYAELNRQLRPTGQTRKGGIGGGITTPPPGAPKQIVNYILVNDIASVLEQVRRSGGDVVTPAMEVPGAGWLAHFTDPDGNVLGLWKPAMGGQV